MENELTHDKEINAFWKHNMAPASFLAVLLQFSQVGYFSYHNMFNYERKDI